MNNKAVLFQKQCLLGGGKKSTCVAIALGCFSVPLEHSGVPETKSRIHSDNPKEEAKVHLLSSLITPPTFVGCFLLCSLVSLQPLIFLNENFL